MTQSLQSRIVAVVIRLMRIKQQLPWQESNSTSEHFNFVLQITIRVHLLVLVL